MSSVRQASSANTINVCVSAGLAELRSHDIHCTDYIEAAPAGGVWTVYGFQSCSWSAEYGGELNPRSRPKARSRVLGTASKPRVSPFIFQHRLNMILVSGIPPRLPAFPYGFHLNCHAPSNESHNCLTYSVQHREQGQWFSKELDDRELPIKVTPWTN